MATKQKEPGKWDAVARELWERVLARVRDLHGPREDGGMTYDQVAQLLGVAQGAVVYGWVAGTKGGGGRQTFADMLRYCEILDIDIVDFLAGHAGRKAARVRGHAGMREVPLAHSGALATAPSPAAAAANGGQSILVPSGFATAGLVAVRAEGSMLAPLLRDGDLAGVDSLWPSAGDTILARGPGRMPVVRSFAPGVGETVLLSGEAMAADAFRALYIGRVAWVLKACAP